MITAIGGIPEWRVLFLRLWDKAVDGPNYSKAEWQELEDKLFEVMEGAAKRKIHTCGYCGMAVFDGTSYLMLKKTQQRFHINCVDYPPPQDKEKS